MEILFIFSMPWKYHVGVIPWKIEPIATKNRKNKLFLKTGINNADKLEIRITNGSITTLNIKSLPMKSLSFSLLFLILEISRVAINEDPNSIVNKIKIPNVWIMPILPNSTTPIDLAIRGSKKRDSR